MLSTIERFQSTARSAPCSSALIGERETVSYGELLDRVHDCADTMRSFGADTIAILGDNSIDWIVADLAAQLARVAIVPVPGFFSIAQIRHALADSGAGAVLLDSDYSALAAALPLTRAGALTSRLEWYLPGAELRASRLHPGTAKVSYTSGTTGAPKGVCLAQSAMDRVAESLVEATRMLGLRRHLCALPLSLLLENIAGVYGPLRNGGEICVPSLRTLGWTGATRLDAERLLDCVAAYQPDSLILVPQMLHSIVERLEQGAIAPASLKFVAVGGGHVSPALLSRADSLGLPVYEGYGLTESASVVAISSPKQRRLGSVGRPLAHSSVRIAANGEVHVSGASHLGYVGGEPQRSDEIATGDVGRLDEDGFLHISGRLKNVYITSFGRNVSPEWIEAELAKQPSIAQVAVFGEARPWSTAVVVPVPGARRSDIQAEITAVNTTLPDYARVGDWITAREPFSPDNQQLTSNGRNRREAIWQAYQAAINARYDEYVAIPSFVYEQRRSPRDFLRGTEIRDCRG
jgi:long-chain acyl-CoA synthetase